MAQPPNAPPEQWERRSDAVTRKLFDHVDSLAPRVDAVRKELDQVKKDVQGVGVEVALLQGKVDQVVTWPKLVFILAAVAGSVITLAWLIVSSNATRGEASLASAQRQMADDVRQIRSESAMRFDKLDAKQEAQLRMTLDGKTRQQAKKELERKTGVPRIDSN